MRRITRRLFVGCVLASAGCNTWMNRGGTVAENAPASSDTPPTVPQLVDYLNVCSSRLNSVRSECYMDCKAKGDSLSLDATMVCEKPRNFRLRAKIGGVEACDIGSNNEEFWYWIKNDNPPYLNHCSYEALSKGNVQLPFPFQPDTVVAALGMGEYNTDPNRYELKVLKNALELSDSVTSADGKPVRRVTVIARGSVDVTKGRPQVTQYILRDMQGRDICKATVERVSVQRGAVVPQKVRLSWPAEKLEMALTLNSTTVNTVDAQYAQRAFSRAGLRHQSFDMARRTLDTGSPIERVRGSQQ